MKTTSYRARALACALLATTACCGLTAAPAHAQEAKAHRQPDANGVDLTHGDFLASFAEGSIGSGEAELALVRKGVWSASTNSNNHQWDDVMLTQERSSGSLNNLVHIGGGVAVRFNNTSTSPDGSATLTGQGSTYIYTAADGTQIKFGNPAGAANGDGSGLCDDSEAQPSCSLLPLSIESPDGKTVTIDWDVRSYCTPGCTYSARIARLSNSFGYRIGFSYADNSDFGVPTSAWFQRTGASFYNDLVSTSTAQASTSYAYPANGVTEVTDTGGRVWRLTGDSNKLTAIRRPGASSDTTTIAYSIGSQVSSVTREGVTTSYSRSVSGSTATMTVTNALNQQMVVTSDLNVGRPTLIKDPLNRTTSFQYDTNGRLTRTTAPEGNYVQLTLDARGNVTERRAVAKPGSVAPDIVSSASYPADCANPATCNQPISTTDARGNATDYSYDSTHGGLLSVTAPAAPSFVRPQTRYEYALINGEYQLTGTSACQTQSSCAGTADEVKTSLAYDSNGNVTSVSSGAGNGSLTASQAMTYDAKGDLLTVDGPLPGSADTMRYRYDATRQLLGTVSPDPDGAGPLKPRAVRTSLRPDGQVTKVERGTVNSQSDADWNALNVLEAVEIGFGSDNRPVTQSLTAGGTAYALTQISYDAVGRPECRAQRMNPAEFGSLPASACSLGTQGSFGPDRIAKTLYDAAGQVAQVRTAVGTADEAAEASSTYTGNGKLETLTDGENNKTTFEYDGHDRLAKTFFPMPTKGALASSTTDYEQYGYDPNGNQTSFRNRAGQTIQFSYDALNRMTWKLLSALGEKNTKYDYDLLGRMIMAGQKLSFTYDALGRRLSETNDHGTFSSAWDLGGRRTRITHPSGFYVDQEYLLTGEMTRIRENGATSGIGVLATFGYDDLGRRTSLVRGNGTSTSYAYDPASRLAQMSHDMAGTGYDLDLTFAYNPAGQITQNTRANDLYAWTEHGSGATGSPANGLNQLASYDGVELATRHDAKGNLTKDPKTGYTFGYSAENLLISANSGTSTGTLKYDALMRLSEAGTSSPRQFAYDGHDRVSEYSSAGSPILRHVFGPGVDEPLVEYRNGYTPLRRFFHADERGSIVAMSDESGAVVGVNRYDEHGKPAAGNIGRFGFAGQPYETVSGLYYSRARMYNPRTGGRFMQPDPIGYGDGPNMYARTKGDPVNKRDPSGLQEYCGGPCTPIVITGEFADGRPGSADPFGGSGQTPAIPTPRVKRIAPEGEGAGVETQQPCLIPADWTRHGDTKGENPEEQSGRYITELPGGFWDANAVFIGLGRLAGDTSVDFPGVLGQIDEPGTIAISRPSGIRFRVSFDTKNRFAPRVDIPENVFSLTKAESIHFTGGKGNMCPIK